MLERELKVLKEYINNNLVKGFIRESTSLASSPVMFVSKKDSKLQLCIDYWKLNSITVKDWYALLLADEMRDQTYRAEVFTKLDL